MSIISKNEHGMQPDALVGSRLGCFGLLERLGKGGQGWVYRAHDAALDRPAAVKVLHPECASSKESVARFLREARALARLRHPGLAAIHAVGNEAGWRYFVMDLIDGETLSERISHTGPLAWQDSLAVIAQLLSALAAAHAIGIIHRDIKPSNVMLEQGNRAVLVDFGLARPEHDTTLTETGLWVGTPEYMAPEQTDGLATPATDLYALGILWHEALTGVSIFRRASWLSSLRAKIEGPFPEWKAVCPAAPAAFADTLRRLLAPDPQARPSSCHALASEILTFAGHPLLHAIVSDALESSAKGTDSDQNLSPTVSDEPAVRSKGDVATLIGVPRQVEGDAVSYLSQRVRTLSTPQRLFSSVETPIDSQAQTIVSGELVETLSDALAKRAKWTKWAVRWWGRVSAVSVGIVVGLGLSVAFLITHPPANQAFPQHASGYPIPPPPILIENPRSPNGSSASPRRVDTDVRSIIGAPTRRFPNRSTYGGQRMWMFPFNQNVRALSNWEERVTLDGDHLYLTYKSQRPNEDGGDSDAFFVDMQEKASELAARWYENGILGERARFFSSPLPATHRRLLLDIDVFPDIVLAQEVCVRYGKEVGGVEGTSGRRLNRGGGRSGGEGSTSVRFWESYWNMYEQTLDVSKNNGNFSSPEEEDSARVRLQLVRERLRALAE